MRERQLGAILGGVCRRDGGKESGSGFREGRAM